jgi:bisanhydrobacterioruberin hydratase
MYQGIPIKRLSIESIGQNKVQWATGIALLIHSVGLMGMIWVDRQWFARMTPLNLLLMFSLIVWTQTGKNILFYIFIALSFVVGMVSEMIGVQSGFLFGNYSYGTILGINFADVPLIIGLNWFVVLYSAIATSHLLMVYLSHGRMHKDRSSTCGQISISLVIGAAFLATFFDWVLEPVAIGLGFWKWEGNGHIPLFNYLSWFFISIILLSIFRLLKIRPDNLFAVHLFLIQLMFFMLLRVFL